MNDNDDFKKNTAKRPGPAPTRSSRQETFRISSKNRREALLASGKVEIKGYISPDTKEILTKLKFELSLDTLGEVIDHVVKQHRKDETK